MLINIKKTFNSRVETVSRPTNNFSGEKKNLIKFTRTHDPNGQCFLLLYLI